VFGSDIVPLNLVRNGGDGVALPTVGKLSPRVETRMAGLGAVQLIVWYCVHRWILLILVFNETELAD
jgi:hypothetical protein